MTKNRLEAFSDGVIAIIITVMVLELKVPDHFNFAALEAQWPEFATYILSYIMLGIYWNNHHHMLHSVEHISGKVMWANLLLLFWLSLLPFATEWVAKASFVGAPVAVFGFDLMMSGVGYYVLSKALVAVNGKDSAVARALGHDYKGKASIWIYLVAVSISQWIPYASCGLYILVAIMWFVPDRRFAQNPTSE